MNHLLAKFCKSFVFHLSPSLWCFDHKGGRHVSVIQVAAQGALAVWYPADTGVVLADPDRLAE